MKRPVLVLILLLSLVSFSVFFGTIQAQTSSSSYTLYAGEVSSSTYGFGDSASHITSPGPTLTLTSGQTVTVTLHNAGTMPHNWALVNAKSSTAAVQWSAQIGSSSNPVPVGSQGSVTFTVGSPGNYYYICQVDAHVSLGMWGNVVVQQAIPEFPAPLLVAFLAVAVTALAAYLGRSNIKVLKRL